MKTKAMLAGSGGGVRKGAWSHEEDKLLRKCIEKYGEGKWHQVPIKAGLNRCRKSCRLRWLNYLKPDIKRGEFGVDEVDLLIRLHKLLGNRWSLIAGRIPGRTANDVKNYWNTHQQKKVTNNPEVKAPAKPPQKKEEEEDHSVAKTTIFKPRARTFSKGLQHYNCANTLIGQNNPIISPPAASKINVTHMPSCQNNNIMMMSGVPAAEADDGIPQWWDEYLFGTDDHEKEIGGSVHGGWCFDPTSTDEYHKVEEQQQQQLVTSTTTSTSFWASVDQLTGATQKVGEDSGAQVQQQQGSIHHDFPLLLDDMDVWDLLNSDQ